MTTSVRTKELKKQSSLSKDGAVSLNDKRFEHSLLTLENACLMVLDNHFSEGRLDTEGRYWQQRFINIANPVSLALMEYKGPRHFHYHYRHRADDESILRPVLENPADMLAQVCEDALAQCRSSLVGMQGLKMTKMRRMFENALLHFLQYYQEYGKDKPNG